MYFYVPSRVPLVSETFLDFFTFRSVQRARYMRVMLPVHFLKQFIYRD